MAENKVDEKTLREEYEKGATPDDLAVKYSLTPEQVVATVVNEAPVEDLPTQAELDTTDTKETKEEKKDK